MSDKDTEYRVRSGEKIAITAARQRDPERPRVLPVGSAPDIAVASELAEMPELAAPSRPSVAVEFGRATIVVEDHDDRVTLVLPGGVRLEGTRDEVRRLVAALREA